MPAAAKPLLKSRVGMQARQKMTQPPRVKSAAAKAGETESEKLHRARAMLDGLLEKTKALSLRAAATRARLG